MIVDPVTGFSEAAGNRQKVAVTILGMGVIGLLVFIMFSLIKDWDGTPPARDDDAKFTTGYFSTKSKPPSMMVQLGEATTNPDAVKKALHLRVGEYVRGNDRGGFLGGPRAVFVWFYSPRTADDTRLVSYTTVNKDIWALKVDREGRLCYCAHDKGGQKVGHVRAQTTDLRDNEWHCVGFVRESDGDVRLYADGTALLGDVEGSLVPTVPPRGSENTFLLVGAGYDNNKLMTSPDHTGVGNLTMWSYSLTPIQVSALSEPYEMVSPLQFITDRAASLLLWMPLWDSDGNNVRDIKNNLTNARVARVLDVVEADDLVIEEQQQGVKRGALPPPIKVK